MLHHHTLKHGGGGVTLHDKLSVIEALFLGIWMEGDAWFVIILSPSVLQCATVWVRIPLREGQEICQLKLEI